MSLSIRDLSVKPARQYLNTVISEIGFLLLAVILEGEFPSLVLSESEGDSSASSKFSHLPSKLVANPFSTLKKETYVDYSMIGIKENENNHEGYNVLGKSSMHLLVANYHMKLYEFLFVTSNFYKAKIA